METYVREISYLRRKDSKGTGDCIGFCKLTGPEDGYRVLIQLRDIHSQPVRVVLEDGTILTTENGERKDSMEEWIEEKGGERLSEGQLRSIPGGARLLANSFLMHGLHNYGYVARVKVKGVDYIGVPGIFYEKEKRAASMYGFVAFEGRQEPAREGDKGLYLIRI